MAGQIQKQLKFKKIADWDRKTGELCNKIVVEIEFLWHMQN